MHVWMCACVFLALLIVCYWVHIATRLTETYGVGFGGVVEVSFKYYSILVIHSLQGKVQII